ncbi:MAG: VacJ family lipoprotein, partial [Deltaproteobacteria bacterium]|nr:VacJ family lipoprotein [Deltaproteobacteria bacterium]
MVVDGVDTRERLTPLIDDVRANSLDPYATFRSAYMQRRAAEILSLQIDETTKANAELKRVNESLAEQVVRSDRSVAVSIDAVERLL